MSYRIHTLKFATKTTTVKDVIPASKKVSELGPNKNKGKIEIGNDSLNAANIHVQNRKG